MSIIVRPPSVSPAHQRRLKRTITRLLDRAHDQAERVAVGLHRTIITQNGTLNPPIIPDLAGDVVGPILTNLLMKIRGTPVSGVAPLDGQALVYNEDAGEWQPGAPGDPSGEIIDYSSLVNEARTSRGATFSASSTAGVEYPAASAADGDDSTYWLSAPANTPADPAAGAWWRTDLGSAKEITWYRVVQPSLTQYRSTSSKLQSSTDDVNWTDRVTFGIFGDSGLDELASPITARYWRMLGVDMDPLPFFTNYWGLATVALYSGQPTVQAPGHVIEDEGTPLAQRTTLNFVGAGVTVTDDSGNDQTDVTIPGVTFDDGATPANLAAAAATGDDTTPSRRDHVHLDPVIAHVAASDPHPDYTTAAELAAALAEYIAKALVDAKGDLVAASAADTPARLAVGSNGQILYANSAEATGLKWDDPPISASSRWEILTDGSLDGFIWAESGGVYSLIYAEVP